MVYNIVDSLTGYWYYMNKRHHSIMKDLSHNINMTEGLLQLYSDDFETQAFVRTFSLCKGDHDDL
jgi:hypothetical protein